MYFCSISSGSSGNCIFIGSNKTKVLIDVGVSRKFIEDSLIKIKNTPYDIKGVLITHEHMDHYKGVSVLCKKYNIPVFINNLTYEAMKYKLQEIKNINIIEKSEFSIGDLDIKTFSLPHDAADPIGYSIINSNKKISIATDLGYVSQEVFDNLKDSNIVLIESNYNEEMVKMSSYPYFLKQRILSGVGHLSNEECGKVIVELIKNFPKKIILGHLSTTNNFPELAYKTVEEILNRNSLKIGKDLELTVAHRSLPSNYMRI